jgi:glycosyltransferase involved in cell wall biosynthesis
VTRQLAIVTPAFARGGSEEFVIAFARHLRGQGAGVAVYLPDVEGVRSVREDLTAADVETGTFPAAPELPFAEVEFLRTREYLVDLFSTRRFDGVIIVLPTIEAGGAMIDAAAWCDVPAVVIYQLVGYPHGFNSLERRMYTWARRRRQAWVAVSEGNRDLLCHSLDWASDAVDVVHNGVLRAPVRPDEGTTASLRMAVRRELGAAPDAVLALTVARLDAQKGYDVALDAAADVAARDPALHYVWIGDGALSDDVRAAIAVRGLAARVHLLGRRGDVDRFLAASDLFVLPSRFEGLPFAVLEALQAGLPGVYSRIQPHEEIVRHGEEGLLVPVEDAPALAAAVQRLATDTSLRRAMSGAARRRAEAFSSERCFERLRLLLSRAGERPARQLWPLPEGAARRRIAIYGTGEGAHRAFEEAMPNEDVVAFLDRDSARRARPFLGRPVLAPSVATTLDVDAVVLASCYYGEMSAALAAIGFPSERVDVYPQVRLQRPARLAS